MAKTEDYLIKEYCAEDKEAVFSLMRDTFASEGMSKSDYFSPQFWRWQYQDSPFGKAVSILAKDNGSVVGQYVNLPVIIKYNSRTQKAALVVDLMVRKPCRRMGLFKKMGQSANTKMSKSGFSISMAFPSRNESYTGFINRLGWFKVGRLQTLFKPILPKIFQSENLDVQVNIQKITGFPQEIDFLWERLKPNINLGIARKRKYLNWRYFLNPAHKYDVFLVFRGKFIAGYFVLRTVKVHRVKIGVIVDMFCLNESDLIQAVIKGAEQHFLQCGAFLYITLKTKLYEELLKKFGFRILPQRLSPKSYTLIVKTNLAGIDPQNLRNIDNWFLQFGDWDVV